MRTFNKDLVPAPMRSEKWDKSLKDIDVEIGCGVGMHPIRYAKAFPERKLVAIEQTKEKFGKFLGRLKNHKLSNIIPVNEDAIHWITHNLMNPIVKRYFILYPNPYPKEKQKNKRWHAMPFMDHLIKTLQEEGSITLASNEKFYIDEARTYLRDFWGLEIVSDESWTDETFPFPFYRTHFEKKYLKRGETVYNLVAVKPARH